MIWARILVYITETADQELLLRNEYLANSGVVPELTRKPSGWWCGWRRKIPGGAISGVFCGPL
jgi:hypothetical protein